MYRNFRNWSPSGRVSAKQSSHLVYTMLDHIRLGIANMGITKDSGPSEVNELIDFVYGAVLREGSKEIESFKTKRERNLQDILDREYYPQYLSNYRDKVTTQVADAISKLDDPKAYANKTLAHWTEELAGKWKPLAAKPNPPLITISPRQAEAYCCQVMMFFGAEGAEVTQFSQDGGIDVVSKQFVAQVKHQESPVGVKVVREIYGVASQERKVAIVFGKNGFTNESIFFATQNGILLISYGRGIASWTVATNFALRNGLGAVLPDAKSVNFQDDSSRAISWKKGLTEFERDKIQ